MSLLLASSLGGPTPKTIYGSVAPRWWAIHDRGLTYSTAPAVSGLADRSDYAHNLANADADATRPDADATGLIFDGDDYLTHPDDADLDGPVTNLILAARVTTTDSDAAQAIITKSGSATGGWGFQIGFDRMRFWTNLSGSQGADGPINLVDGGTYTVCWEYTGGGVDNATRLNLYQDDPVTAATISLYYGTIGASIAGNAHTFNVGTWADLVQGMNGKILRAALVFGTNDTTKRRQLFRWLEATT